MSLPPADSIEPESSKVISPTNVNAMNVSPIEF